MSDSSGFKDSYLDKETNNKLKNEIQESAVKSKKYLQEIEPIFASDTNNLSDDFFSRNNNEENLYSYSEKFIQEQLDKGNAIIRKKNSSAKEINFIKRNHNYPKSNRLFYVTYEVGDKEILTVWYGEHF